MSHGLDRLFGDADGVDPGATPIAYCNELRRLLQLPQRDAEELGRRIAKPLTRRLRRPGGSMELWPLQATALAEAHDLRGLLAILPVGEGKTLITYLLPIVLNLFRPILLVPGALEDKTHRDFARLAEHWQGPQNYRVVTYELVSRRESLLYELEPDGLIADEVDALKNPGAGVTKRVRWYMRDRARASKPICFGGLSGTIANRSYLDFWHIQQWALPPQLQPLPFDYQTLVSWCAALDEKLKARRPLGELWRLAGKPNATVKEVRRGFGRRFRGLPGVVGSSDASKVGASLRIELIHRKSQKIDEAVAYMRRTWATPGGEEFWEAVDMWRHARELANGFYYIWDPPPPKWWLQPRKDFHAFIRGVLSGSRKLATMADVLKVYPTQTEVLEWRMVEKEYEPNQVPVWLTDEIIEYAADWAYDNNGIVWVEHKAVGHRMQDRFGLPYFGEKGNNAAGVNIEQHEGKPASLSATAGIRGFNLQYDWSNNLVLNQLPVGRAYEQMLGRTHRKGTKADAVYAGIVFTVREQIEGFEQARLDAAWIQETTEQPQRLCFADYL